MISRRPLLSARRNSDLLSIQYVSLLLSLLQVTSVVMRGMSWRGEWAGSWRLTV